MTDGILREAVLEFVERMQTVLGRLHNAMEEEIDVDEQHSAIAEIVGLIEMLKSAADNRGMGDDDEDGA